MSEPAIRVQNLGKQYQLGAREAGYVTFREAISGLFTNPVRRFKSLSGRATEDESFWALKDVSFEVQPGEVIGIIGHNGAGKSTLLKILSQITEPTEGRVEIDGRIGSLLEVGTGFHPELSGRENIFLNGSILGMSREEVRRKFDEIVAFAEVEKFLDMPVKKYSSGMSVRLAFSVAAHLDPEILIIDEVLAVGDQAFQNKCLGKMSGVAESGRTILFVSHQMAAVEAMCSSVILLSEGRIKARGETSKIVERYLRGVSRGEMQPLQDRRDRKGSGAVRFESVSFSDGRGRSVMSFQCGSPAEIVLSYQNHSERELRNLRVCIGIDNEFGQRVLLLDSKLVGRDLAKVDPDGGTVRFQMPKLALLPGCYHFTIFSTLNGEITDWVKNAGFFYVEGGSFFVTGQLPEHGDGIVATEHEVYFEPAAGVGRASDPPTSERLTTEPASSETVPIVS
ncbi:MAG TPA: ABC transporter ATP-binding protein [Planctomycetaceae bacterium]|jgi:lipopolysaccharide transport system ATP-binding protein|nr:ABC transporter ATP-binding protein [Planctomycetaceae bacterium]